MQQSNGSSDYKEELLDAIIRLCDKHRINLSCYQDNSGLNIKELFQSLHSLEIIPQNSYQEFLNAIN